MDAVLFVGHGSRDERGNEEVREFVASVASTLKADMVELCFLEFVTPTMKQGFDICVAKGATRIAVIPITLFSAGHAKLHMPAAIDEAKLRYPAVNIIYGRPIGVHDQVLEILTSRLGEAVVAEESELADTAILIVGRGSSDADANSELFKISRLFWERLKVKWVETAFIGVTAPLMDEGVERCLKLGARKVIILPYFLFTGVLIKRMEAAMEQYTAAYPDTEFVLAEYFGFHPLLKEILKDRAAEALQDEVKMNCDMCQFRLQAMKDHDHHHHHDHDHDHHDHHHDHHDHDHGHEHHAHDHGHDHHHDHEHHAHDHEHHEGHTHEHNHDHHDHDHHEHEHLEIGELAADDGKEDAQKKKDPSKAATLVGEG
ncbi:sirohydrochlorin cobaltochelatase [Paenibacillus sp. BIHB 4019]|uniref:Sirohydrochlorin cobaltochelatase n=1 Tax=Paenibacillus sp. BIHB 4019 TaxID=1870819 RepID=A0A1B2DPC7_9BACL|nr:sirohydrochlorin chelatase [Paenibacillus sp. BIHB 4019]ANY69564.1 sirohydrochlorin cobaltochelatase [Paenibacillus sp. BIHB 4019]